MLVDIQLQHAGQNFLSTFSNYGVCHSAGIFLWLLLNFIFKMFLITHGKLPYSLPYSSIWFKNDFGYKTFTSVISFPFITGTSFG
jgi:hypothetical protein